MNYPVELEDFEREHYQILDEAMERIHAITTDHRLTPGEKSTEISIVLTNVKKYTGTIVREAVARAKEIRAQPDPIREEWRRRIHVGMGQTDTNAEGGKQSKTDYFFRGLPPLALQRVARILKTGAEKYEADPFGNIRDRNWHKISSDEHLEHVIYHAIMHMTDDTTEDHAGNLATRSLFFLHQWITENGPTGEGLRG